MPTQTTPRPTRRRPAPACGCTRTSRCAEARRLRNMHQEAWESQDTPAITAARQQYGGHLRQAGVKPGQAVWEEHG